VQAPVPAAKWPAPRVIGVLLWQAKPQAADLGGGQAGGGGLGTAGRVILGLWRAARRFPPWPDRLIGLVLGFGAGTLVSAVSFELAGEGPREAGLGAVAVGMAIGALTFYALAGASDRFSQRRALGGAVVGGTGFALALGAILDGILEMLVLGISSPTGRV
jgi:ZIP family zinc transporter